MLHSTVRCKIIRILLSHIPERNMRCHYEITEIAEEALARIPALQTKSASSSVSRLYKGDFQKVDHFWSLSFSTFSWNNTLFLKLSQ